MNTEKWFLRNKIWGTLTLVWMIIALGAIFVYVPTEKNMGIVQRIFYFHVSSAWLAFLSFGVVFIASILFLWKKSEKWDVVGVTSAEIGVIFTSLVLLTGPLWAKPSWNTWWTWDPRLSTTVVLWFIYVSYLMLRAFTIREEKGARIAAVFGIIGFIDVPIVFMSIRWWKTIHPVVIGSSDIGLAPKMIVTMIISLIAFTFLYIWLFSLRISIERARREIKRIRNKLMD